MRVINITVGLALSFPLLAQTTLNAGALRGTVRDDSGAFLAGAKLVLIEESKGVGSRVRIQPRRVVPVSFAECGGLFSAGPEGRLQHRTDQQFKD